LSTTVDAIYLRASSGSGSLNDRGRLSFSELSGDRERLARYMERAGSLAAAGQSGIVLLDHSRWLLCFPRPSQL